MCGIAARQILICQGGCLGRAHNRLDLLMVFVFAFSFKVFNSLKGMKSGIDLS